MHHSAPVLDIGIRHGHKPLKTMPGAKLITTAQVRDIYQVLEAHRDLPLSWQAVRQTVLRRIFGSPPR
jgi:hypothetical protein